MDDFEEIKKLTYSEAQELHEYYANIANLFEKRNSEHTAAIYHELARACIRQMQGRTTNLRCRPEGYRP